MITLAALLSLPALSQFRVGLPEPVPAPWIRNGGLIVPDYNFSIDSPGAEPKWAYREVSPLGKEKGVAFIAEYSTLEETFDRAALTRISDWIAGLK